MLKKSLFLILSWCFLVTPAFGRLFLDVSIVNKKGIDIGLTLGSELHSIEEVRHNENILLKMRSGIQVVLDAYFIEERTPINELEASEVYGPSSFVVVKGKILDSQNKVLKDFTKDPLKIPLEGKQQILHSQESQLVEVTLRPHLN
jgi:hypothetical protein